MIEKRLHFEVTRENGDPVVTHVLSLSPFRRILKDYFLICESYYAAIRTAFSEPDRGDRHGAARGSQRGIGTAGGTAEGQDLGRSRYGAPTVHVGMRTLPERLNAVEAPAPMPGAVLFVCGMNAVRSPMAVAITRHLFPRQIYFASAGVRKGERDPFVDAVLAEIGLHIDDHAPRR